MEIRQREIQDLKVGLEVQQIFTESLSKLRIIFARKKMF